MARPGGKRGDAVPRPALRSDWTLRFASKEAAATWAQMSKKYAGQLRIFWDRVAESPRFAGDPHRHHRLSGDLGTDAATGLERWQCEVSTTGARIWFLIDDEAHEIRLTHVTLSHPNPTK